MTTHEDRHRHWDSTKGLLLLLQFLGRLRDCWQFVLALFQLWILQFPVLSKLQVNQVGLEMLFLLKLRDVLVNEVVPLLFFRGELIWAFSALLNELVREVL